MVTEERKQEIAETCRAWVAEQTCTKAHRFTVGSCIACERDDLLEKAKAVLAWWDAWMVDQPQDDKLEAAEWSEFFKLRTAVERAGN